MSKVQVRFHLLRPLDEKLLFQIADSHTIYGILRVKVDPSLDTLTVEYDASRLERAEVEAALTNAGIPVKPVQKQ